MANDRVSTIEDKRCLLLLDDAIGKQEHFSNAGVTIGMGVLSNGIATMALIISTISIFVSAGLALDNLGTFPILGIRLSPFMLSAIPVVVLSLYLIITAREIPRAVPSIDLSNKCNSRIERLHSLKRQIIIGERKASLRLILEEIKEIEK